MNHLVISGPGRSGTTLLVELFTRLGFDTGIDRLDYFPSASAGWEAELRSPDAPYVVKQPELIFGFRKLIDIGAVAPAEIDALVVPLRDLHAVVASRINVTLSSGGVVAEGGLTGTKRPDKQLAVLAAGVYELLQTAAMHDVPIILLDYPRFALDAPYAYRRLAPVLGGIDERNFRDAHAAVVDKEKVRAAPPASPRTAGLTVVWRRLQHRVRGWRRNE